MTTGNPATLNAFANPNFNMPYIGPASDVEVSQNARSHYETSDEEDEGDNGGTGSQEGGSDDDLEEGDV